MGGQKILAPPEVVGVELGSCLLIVAVGGAASLSALSYPCGRARMGQMHTRLAPHTPFLCCSYVVRDLLGQGTFGQVFKCVCVDDEDDSEAIAIKASSAKQHSASDGGGSAGVAVCQW